MKRPGLIFSDFPKKCVIYRECVIYNRVIYTVHTYGVSGLKTTIFFGGVNFLVPLKPRIWGLT